MHWLLTELNPQATSSVRLSLGPVFVYHSNLPMKTTRTDTERSTHSTGMFSGACLFAAATFIAYQSIVEIRTPHHSPAWFTLPVLIAVIVVKELLSRRVFAAADTFDSNALQGDAWHHRSDAITSAAAAIGITIALIGGKGWEMADDWGALAACSVIVTNALLIVKRSVYDATDRAASPQIRESICTAAANQPRSPTNREMPY
jgi:divalent metal cation (Fe/Co/Zn/Cd) transporter